MTQPATSTPVFVTGGSGFIGQALVPALLNRGHPVTVLTRSPETAAKHLPDAVTLVTSIAGNANWQHGIVINLAGENLFTQRWTDSRKQTLLDSRIETTRELVNTMRTEQPPELFISGSAIGYYGMDPSGNLTEDAKPGDDFAAVLCQRWEAAALEANDLTAVALTRLGVVLDDDGGALERMLPPFKLGVGGRLGSGKQDFSWITRHDLVRLFLYLIDQHAEGQTVAGAWNSTAPAPVTNAEFTQALGDALNRPTAIPVPAFALKLMLGEAAGMLLGGARVLPTRAQSAGFRFEHETIKTALTAVL